MASEAVILSVIMIAVFIGFAAVLARADHRPRPSQQSTPAPKRRSF